MDIYKRYSVWLWQNTKAIRPQRIGYGFESQADAEKWAQHVNGPYIITEEDEDGQLKIIKSQS